MPALSWTKPALEDVRRIEDWLSKNAAPEIAVQVLGTIRSRSRVLERFPHAGRPLRDSGARVLLTRETQYLLVYRVLPETIEILRVRQARENWKADL